MYGPNASSGVGCSAVRRLLRRSRCCGPYPVGAAGGGFGLGELAELAGLPGNDTGGRWRLVAREQSSEPPLGCGRAIWLEAVADSNCRHETSPLRWAQPSQKLMTAK